MNERDFLQVAALLVAENTEAAWRSAVSRAYYAAFHVARLLLIDFGFTVPRDEKAHTFLYRRLNNCGDPPVLVAAQQLGNLRDQRNKCDYDLRLFIPQQLATQQLQAAKNIIQTLDDARLEPRRTQITDAMKIYERDVLKTVTWHP
jgi:uncharacterized protein (UPF0332 family)